MSYLEAIALGLLQAFTEFLPVSSSGHLVLAQSWFGGHEIDVLFNVLLHTATMLAVLVYFRQEILALLAGLFGRVGEQPPFAGFERKAAWLIVAANVPTALIGLFIERFLEDSVSAPAPVGAMLMTTGVVLWAGRGRDPRRTIAEMTLADAMIIGVVQGVAVFPGLSRAGLTIVAAMLLGLERSLAAKYSLLISIPAIAGATLLQALDSGAGAMSAGPYLSGMLVAGVVGYAAIHLILLSVKRHQFYRFAFYVWPLGALALLTDLL